MFYVELSDSKNKILGNLDGQGFYDYKRIGTVISKINLRGEAIAKYYKRDIEYKIYNISESEKYKDFENYKKPEIVLKFQLQNEMELQNII